MPSPPRLETARERPARRRALTVDAIVDAALGIVDAEGLDALTMRSVAAALGTGAASLYAYVESKERLVELVVERVIGEMGFEGEPDPGRWMEQLKEMARGMRQVWARHGDLARASFGRIPVGENALAGSEWMIGVLRAGGLPDRVVGFACDLLPLYITAVAYEDSLMAAGDHSYEDVLAFIAELREYLAAQGERYPAVAAMAGALTAGDHNSRFEFGLDVILRGLASYQ
ncbi:MAG: TetR/AcrR family transcriptional regulator C-terminal domain-containing protein [Solirubrobacterales bacterium]|nr:TetR/AcrR family transcriptional regulator C-terminal domain-containing protein [Solirubrobacterales bacterium]